MTSGQTETLFHAVRFDPRDRSSRIFERAELESVLADDPVFCWIDLQGPNIEVLNELLRLREIDLKLVSHFGRRRSCPASWSGPAGRDDGDRRGALPGVPPAGVDEGERLRRGRRAGAQELDSPSLSDGLTCPGTS